MNGKIHFGWRVQRVPVDGQGVVGELLNVTHQAQTVLGVHIDDPLFYLQKETSMNLLRSIVKSNLDPFFALSPFCTEEIIFHPSKFGIKGIKHTHRSEV